jgi:hypothetical protein
MKKIRLGPASRPGVPVIPLVKLLLMMKMTAIIICMCSMQSFALIGRAQEKVSLNLKQSSIKKALKAIEKQTSIHFVYNDEMLHWWMLQ